MKDPRRPSQGRPQVVLSQPGVRGQNFRASPKSDGQFTLTQVIPGEWELDVAGLPRGTFLKSARLGDKDVLVLRTSNLPQAMCSFKLSSARTPRLSRAKWIRKIRTLGEPASSLLRSANFTSSHAFITARRPTIRENSNWKGSLQASTKSTPRKLAAAGFRNPDAVDKLDSLGEEIELKEGFKHCRPIPS